MGNGPAHDTRQPGRAGDFHRQCPTLKVLLTLRLILPATTESYPSFAENREAPAVAAQGSRNNLLRYVRIAVPLCPQAGKPRPIGECRLPRQEYSHRGRHL